MITAEPLIRVLTTARGVQANIEDNLWGFYRLENGLRKEKDKFTAFLQARKIGIRNSLH